MSRVTEVVANADRLSKFREQSKTFSRTKMSESGTYRSRKTISSLGLKHRQQQQQQHQQQQQQQHQQQQQQLKQVAETILQRRERLRIFYEGEDLTPRFLVHPLYSSVDDKRTAFDLISLAQVSTSRIGSSPQLPVRTSFVTPSLSFTSIYTVDEIIAAKQNESLLSCKKESFVESSKKAFDVVEDTQDVPSQFHLPRPKSREFTSPNDKVTIVLKETETFFLFEMPQLTEDATSAEGEAVLQENERYRRILTTAERKTINVETQTPLIYTKTRGTCISRHERKNCGTIVNNWVMHDTFQNKNLDITEPREEIRFKFREPKSLELHREAEDQLEKIVAKVEYDHAARITLRILAGKKFAKAQMRFLGLLRQDPCDPNLELVYGLELLWQHTQDDMRRRRISAIQWNPINNAIMAVGYTSPTKMRNSKNNEGGVVIVWCAKNPSLPDRIFQFNSSVSDLNWSRTRPNLLAVGFYDGVVRVIDVSKKKLTVIQQSDRKTVPSYEPQWQVLWWPTTSESFETEDQGEQLYTCNQDGRIYCFTPDENFLGRELLRLWRTEGKVPGVELFDQCPSQDVPVLRSTGVLVLRYHPGLPGIYLVGTEEGYVHRCSTSHHRGHLETFLAHNGPIYDLHFSPFWAKLLLTCGADWTTRIWAEGLNEPLLIFTTTMACVTSACWSPRNSTVFASAVGNEVVSGISTRMFVYTYRENWVFESFEYFVRTHFTTICIWDIRRKMIRPASVTRIAQGATIQRIGFTQNGEQIVAGDDDGNVYVYGTIGMPLQPFDQKQTLIDAVEKALLIKPELLKRFKKLSLSFKKPE